MNKFCVGCGKNLPVSLFYKNGKYYYTYCKICKSSISKLWESKNRDKRHLRKDNEEYRRKTRESQRLIRKLNWKKIRKEQRVYREKYPEKGRAKRIVRDALYKGRLVREKCRDCHRTDTQGHHPDYSKPLEVIWLCPPHHMKEHVKIRELVEKTKS